VKDVNQKNKKTQNKETKMQMTTCNPRFARRGLNRNSHLFNEFFAPFDGVFNQAAVGTHFPVVDIYEKDEKLVFEAELPGLEKENINVDVKGRTLSLSGERENKNEVKEEGRYRKERRFGKFERSFKLPFEVTEEQIDATYRNGVLVLTVDKPEEQKPKQITIN
jgi:HSP20 family protein